MLKDILELNIFDFFSVVQTIRIGYKDKYNQLHYEEDDDYYDYEYLVSSPQEVIDNNCGWCFDMINLIRLYCDYNKIEHTTLFAEYEDDLNYIAQLQVILKYQDKWYFAPDNTLKEPFGFLSYPTKEACISSFVNDIISHSEFHLKENYNKDHLFINQFNTTFQTNDNFETCIEIAHKKFN